MTEPGQSKRTHSPRPRGVPGWGTTLVLLAALGLLIVGLGEPAIRVHTFPFITREHSIYSGIMAFFDNGHTALGVFLLAVSVIFPIVKIVAGLLIVSNFTPGHVLTNGLLALLSALARWSMTDVFVLAVMILILDGRILTSADLKDGAYYFTAGILLSMAATYSLMARARRMTPRRT